MKIRVHNEKEANTLIKEAKEYGDLEKYAGSTWVTHDGQLLFNLDEKCEIIKNDSKMIARLIELIEIDIMETKHLLDMAREDFDRIDANDTTGQSHVLTVIAQQMRKLAQLQAEHRDWTLKT